MSKNQKISSLKERHDRYLDANVKLDQWKPYLQEAYKYIFPNRESFYSSTSAQSKTDEIFDETALIGGIQFANNLQSLLMPPYRRWVEIVAGDLLTQSSVITDDEIKQINENLQDVTKTLFRNISSSNFNYVINESFQDICIGTAVIALNEGDLDNPFEFVSIPLKDICFEEDSKGNLENFWHKIEVKISDIKNKWPTAKLSMSITDSLRSDPNKRIELIEACVCSPENEDGFKYIYYVSTADGKEEIVSPIFREFNPFTAARYSKMPGEVWGRGVGLLALPSIKVLNKAQEFILRAAKFKAIPAFMSVNTDTFNAYNVRIEPGSIIPYRPDLGGHAPIEQIPNGGDPNFTQMFIEERRASLRELFFSNPLGQPGETPNQTATEASLRQQNFMRQNGAAIGRLAYEFIIPLVNKMLIILKRKGLIKNIKSSLGTHEVSIKNKTVTFKYLSPLLSQQNDNDAQKLIQYLQVLMQSFGPNALVSLNIFKLPSRVAELMGIDLDLVKNESEVQQAFQQMQQSIQHDQTQ